MLTVSQALDAILGELAPLPPLLLGLHDALGLVLAEAAVSDIDSPPFDKALMDGYACRAVDLAAPETRLRVIEEVTAGRVPTKALEPGQATRIMTGAPLPAGADTVIPVEETRLVDDHVTILPAGTVAGANILRRAAAARTGQQIVPAGRTLRAQEIAALAELGRSAVPVYRRPRVAVLATGDELVPAGTTPGPGQIRNSNEPMLLAQMRQLGADAISLGIARDEPLDLRHKIERGLTCDLLLLSGGVSAGKLDLVPAALAAAGVRQVFHKIQMKPGKPLWFGVFDSPAGGDGSRCGVFGLPGNPVSSMVCAELFVRAALRRLSGIEPAAAAPLQARLTEERLMRGNRPTYHPARLDWHRDGPTVRPVDWIGSSDLLATVDANALVLFPAGDRTWAAGEWMDVWPW